MNYSIAVIGEAVADAVTAPGAPAGTLRLEVRPGGGPVNTAVALARLGSPTRYFGRLSRGVLGRLLREHLAGSAVDLSATVSVSREATLAVASLDEHGRADYAFYLDGTADWDWRPAELEPLTGSGIIHTGSLALARPPGAEVITRALRRHRDHAVVSIDPNVRPGIASPRRYRDGIDAWAGLADVLKLSDEDAAFAYPGADSADLIRRWHRQGCRLIIITLGERGCVASLDGETVRVPAPRVTPVDTIGAGDAFTAGLLHRLRGIGPRLDGLDADTLRQALELACRVAARTCEVPGADPPWSKDLG